MSGDQTTGTNASGFAGQWNPENSTTQFNAIHFLIKQLINLLATATLVKVLAVSTNDEVGPTGTVDVQPLVNLLDGNGNSSSIAQIFGLPFFRLQGGDGAIILDPKVDDIGLAVFADRDISSVKNNRDQANPGSRRRFDMADGMYIGGFLNDTPLRYLRFRSDGLELADDNGNSIVFGPSGIAITGNITTMGTLKNNGVNVGSTHVHSGVTSGSSDSGPPIP